jgi:hypothetical protein
MSKLSMALVAAGLLSIASAYAGDQSGSQQGGATQSGDSSADDRTTQGNEPGTGVRRGSNEGGTGRDPTAEQPTATPGTGDTREPNRGAGVGQAGGGSQTGDSSADQSSGGSNTDQQGQGSPSAPDR